VINPVYADGSVFGIRCSHQKTYCEYQIRMARLNLRDASRQYRRKKCADRGEHTQ